MTIPFDQGAMQSFGAPPAPPSGMRRLTPVLKAVAAGSVLTMAGMYVAQVVLPARFTPATVTGQAAGQTEAADIDVKAKIKTAYEAGLAEASAQAQARAQIEIETNRQEQQLRADALSTQSGFANLADGACIGGRAVAGLGSQNTGKDWHDLAGAVAQFACGAGDALRDNITKQQAAAARTGGAVMNRNTYGEAEVPQPVAQQPAERPSHRYSEEEQAKLAPFVLKMPEAVKASLRAGLDFKDQEAVDILCDRIVTFLADHSEYASN